MCISILLIKTACRIIISKNSINELVPSNKWYILLDNCSKTCHYSHSNTIGFMTCHCKRAKRLLTLIKYSIMTVTLWCKWGEPFLPGNRSRKSNHAFPINFTDEWLIATHFNIKRNQIRSRWHRQIWFLYQKRPSVDLRAAPHWTSY